MTSLSPHCEHILGEIPSVHEVSAIILRLEHGAVGRNMIADLGDGEVLIGLLSSTTCGRCGQVRTSLRHLDRRTACHASDDPENERGIQLADHMSKALTVCIVNRLMQAYTRQIGNYCKLTHLSAFERELEITY